MPATEELTLEETSEELTTTVQTEEAPEESVEVLQSEELPEETSADQEGAVSNNDASESYDISFSCNYDIELQESIYAELALTNLQLYRINQQNDLLLSLIVAIVFCVVCYKILYPFTRM